MGAEQKVRKYSILHTSALLNGGRPCSACQARKLVSAFSYARLLCSEVRPSSTSLTIAPVSWYRSVRSSLRLRCNF